MKKQVCRTKTAQEVAEILGIGLNQTYTAMKAGQIPTVRVGRRLLVPVDALDGLLKGAAATTAK